jgi:hypothetical protein
MLMEGAPRPLDPGKENAIMTPLQLPHGEGRGMQIHALVRGQRYTIKA